MAKNSLNDWSTTPSSNTDIAGTNINVGCPPQDVGTFMRTIMAQIAYAVQGSGGTIPATWHVGQLIGPVKGTTDGSNAAAGNVGEYIFSSVAAASAVAIASATQTDLTNITLTPGDWDVSGVVAFTTGGTGISAAAGGASLTATNLDAYENGGAFLVPTSLNSGSTMAFSIGTRRVNVTANTPVYLIGLLYFTGGTPKAYGRIEARRA